jgi:hypothetical protein
MIRSLSYDPILSLVSQITALKHDETMTERRMSERRMTKRRMTEGRK